MSSGPVIPHDLSGPKRLLAALVYGLIRLVSATVRFEFQNPPEVLQASRPQPVIFSVWHNRLALALPLYRKLPQRLHPTRRLAAIVSASRDGALVARILEMFGVTPVRGSSSRRGAQALLELTSWAERGYDLAITPDGPRGPCYTVQDGVIALAQLTGLPIVPVVSQLHWKLRLRSWDRFQVPLPGSRCTVVFGEPLHVPREANEAERERLRRLLEQQMRTMMRD